MCLSPQFDAVVAVGISVVAVDALRHCRTGRELPLALLPAIFVAHTLLSAVIWLGVDGLVSEDMAQSAATLYLFIAYALLPIYVPIAILLIEPPGWHRRAVIAMCGVGAIPAVGYAVALGLGRGTATPDSYYIAFSVDGTAGLLGVLYVVSTCGALLLSGSAPLISWGLVNAVVLSGLIAWNSLGLPALWCLWAAMTSVCVAWFMRRTPAREPDWVETALQPRGLRPYGRG
jgi:hypothetical protein